MRVSSSLSTEKKKLYWTKRWREFSRRFLEANPKCYVCGERSKCVDHIQAVKDFQNYEKVFWKKTNVIPLCNFCHAKVTKKFDQFGGTAKERFFNFREKINWIKKMRVRYENDTHLNLVDY